MKPIRVLIADPDESLLSWCREYLSRHGLEVATASSGLDCVAHLRSFAPDALVLEPELLWGGADGVLAMMEEDPSVPRVPVLILFAWQVYAWQDRPTLDSLPSSFIGKQMAKPLALRLLVKEVTELLDGTPPRAGIERRDGSANDEANTNNEANSILETTPRGDR
jgi:DNA-binding response OmpR family regulator